MVFEKNYKILDILYSVAQVLTPGGKADLFDVIADVLQGDTLTTTTERWMSERRKGAGKTSAYITIFLRMILRIFQMI